MHEFDWGVEKAAEAFAGKDLHFSPSLLPHHLSKIDTQHLWWNLINVIGDKGHQLRAGLAPQRGIEVEGDLPLFAPNEH